MKYLIGLIVAAALLVGGWFAWQGYSVTEVPEPVPAPSDPPSPDPEPAPEPPPPEPEVDDEIYDLVEQAPQFTSSPTHQADLFGFFGENMEYPQQARDAGILGVVYIQFIVEKDGTTTNCSVLRSPHDLLSTEALRLCNAMPVWAVPAYNQGKKVRVRFSLPIRFSSP